MQLGMLFVRESEDCFNKEKCKHFDIARVFWLCCDWPSREMLPRSFDIT